MASLKAAVAGRRNPDQLCPATALRLGFAAIPIKGIGEHF
jgi:hypothetical protein